MKHNPVAKNAHKFNKSQVMKDRKKAMKKGERKHKGKMDEKLSAKDDAGEWVKDFRKSDAPQFKGKSDKKKQQMAIAAYLDAKRGAKNEDLRKWFGKGKEGDWVRVGTDGEIKGDCARDEGEGKPKCMPRSKAHGMSKKDRASAARRKRHHDPDADRPGTGNKPIMVSTKKEALELEEKNVPNNPKLWAKFKAQAKSKFDVYPSAYANGWAAKQYKAAGGTWKSVKEGKNTPGDGNPCWDTHKKVGTKIKNGKRVNDCVPKNESTQIQEKSVHVRLDHLDGDPRQKKVTDVLKKYEKSRAIEFDGETDKGAIFKVLKPAMISGLNRDLKPFATSAVNESISEWACNRTEKARRVAGGDKRKKYMKEKQVEEGSAQDRLNRRAAKLGIGNRNKAADDYIANLMKKYGAKDMADLKKKMKEGLEEAMSVQQRSAVSKVSAAKRKEKTATTNAMKKAAQRAKVDQRVNEELTPVQKRKYMNLKKRAKAGNSQAKIRLRSFEKEFAKELDMERGSAAKTKKAVRGKGAADPHSGQAFSGSGGGSGDDKNIVTQLRKAQDMDGKMDIELARGKKVRAPKSLIDKILGRFDQLQKPQDKKKFMDLVTKELMKKAK